MTTSQQQQLLQFLLVKVLGSLEVLYLLCGTMLSMVTNLHYKKPAPRTRLGRHLREWFSAIMLVVAWPVWLWDMDQRRKRGEDIYED